MVHESWLLRAVAAIAVLLSARLGALAAPFVFSLDNRPRAPHAISIDPNVINGGNGAEDPFGRLSTPSLVGPSPSLLTFSPQLGRTLSDADLLIPGTSAPVVNVRRPQNTNYIDAISTNLAAADGLPVRVAFSVDRASQGVIHSAVHEQFSLNQQPGDIFISEREFDEPSAFVGQLLGSGWTGFLAGSGMIGSNRLLVNQSTLKLTAGGGPGVFVESNVEAPPIGIGTHDHVDAFDFSLPDTSGNLITDESIYFSVNPDQPTIPPITYQSAADIYRTPPNTLAHVLFASAAQMGLDNPWINSDDIDALVVYDLGTTGTLAEPGIDYALFSLSPGSQSLSTYGLTAADIFFTDFQGSFATYATDAALGLWGTINPVASPDPGGGLGASSGPEPMDNMSGLAFGYEGDMEWDGDLDMDDVQYFVQGLTRPDDYVDEFVRAPEEMGDFTGDRMLDFDDIPPFRALLGGVPGGSPLYRPGVPEPSVAALAATLAVVATGSRRRSAFCVLHS